MARAQNSAVLGTLPADRPKSIPDRPDGATTAGSRPAIVVVSTPLCSCAHLERQGDSLPQAFDRRPGLVQRADPCARCHKIPARSTASNGRARCEFRGRQSFGLKPLKRGVDRARGDAAIQSALHFIEDGPPVSVLIQVDDCQQDRLLELSVRSRQAFSTYTVGVNT